MQSKRIWTTSSSRREFRANSPNTLAKLQNVYEKNKYGDRDTSNDSLAGSKETFGNDTYKLPVVQAIAAADKRKRKQFCVDMQDKLEEDELNKRLVLSDDQWWILGEANEAAA